MGLFYRRCVVCRGRAAVRHSGRMQQQDSVGSPDENVEQMVEDISDVAESPQFTIRQDLDSRRPTATVQVFT